MPLWDTESTAGQLGTDAPVEAQVLITYIYQQLTNQINTLQLPPCIKRRKIYQKTVYTQIIH